MAETRTFAEARCSSVTACFTIGVITKPESEPSVSLIIMRTMAIPRLNQAGGNIAKMIVNAR